MGAIAVVALVACEPASNLTVQAVAGPSVTVAPRESPSEQAVSWSEVPSASRYDLFQSAGAGQLVFLVSVTGATSYIAEDLASGIRYCYAVRSVFSDGSTSDVSAAGCATTAGAVVPGATRRRNVPLAVQFANPTNAWTPIGAGLRSVSTGGLNPGDSATTIDVPFEVGETVIGAEVWRFSDGTAGRKAALLVLAAGNDFIIAASEDSIDGTATTRAVTSVNQINGVSPHTMAAGERLRFLVFARPSPGYTIDAVNLLYTAAP